VRIAMLFTERTWRRDTQGLARRGALLCQIDVAPLPVMVSFNALPFWYLQRYSYAPVPQK